MDGLQGENDLSSFADELAEFGPVLKSYADSVRDLDPNVIVNSANAAKLWQRWLIICRIREDL